MQVEHEHLRLIATPHLLSTEKGRLDVQRPAGVRSCMMGLLMMLTCP